MKVDARRFGAFDSPNCPPLATVEAGIEGKILVKIEALRFKDEDDYFDD